jgi:hypothetical protein
LFTAFPGAFSILPGASFLTVRFVGAQEVIVAIEVQDSK